MRLQIFDAVCDKFSNCTPALFTEESGKGRDSNVKMGLVFLELSADTYTFLEVLLRFGWGYVKYAVNLFTLGGIGL